MKIEWGDEYLRRIVEVEHDDDEVLLFDCVEEDDQPGIQSCTSYPPAEARRIGMAFIEQANAVEAMRDRRQGRLRLVGGIAA